MNIVKRGEKDYHKQYTFLINRLKIIRDASATLCEYETDVLIGAIFTLADKQDVFVESNPHRFPNIQVKIFSFIGVHQGDDFYGNITLDVTPETWSVILGVVIPGYHGPESVQEAVERMDFDYFLDAVNYILNDDNMNECKDRIYRIADEMYKKG